MVTHAEIEAVEEVLIESYRAIRSGQSYSVELATVAATTAARLANTERRENGHLLPENRDHWGTLGCNAACVATVATDPELRKAAKAAAKAAGR
jgi:hypothetical protein